MINNNLFPWQEKAWQLVNLNPQRMHHALLLHGKVGIGKYVFARHLAQSLLCHNKNAEQHACGLCSSCLWFREESHPDFRQLSPEQEREAENEDTTTKKQKKKTQISVAQVRDLNDFINMSSHSSGGLRVVLITPAEALNLASANALLKLLEEPADGVIFILLAQQLQQLLPTIISRCKKISMPVPDESQSLAWLNAQGISNAKQQLAYFSGSPINVRNEQMPLNVLEDICRLLAKGSNLPSQQLAPALVKNSVEAGIVVLQKWLYDIVAVKLAQQVRYHLTQVEALQMLAEKINLSKLFQLQKKLDELRKLAMHPLNHELQIESLLLEYTKIFTLK